MIRIDSIDIEEFRGIKKLHIALNKKSFGICGPNGTGKSGIVDAIEFALTGDITRLGGAGSAELSVKEHAPHVDAIKTPSKSIVKIEAFSHALNKPITIERTVKSPTVPTVTPAGEKTAAVVAKLAQHPEFALSRREIVKYILTPAGQRSKDVQALLKLDQIERVRQSLQRVANDAKRDEQNAVIEDERAKRELQQHLSIKALSKTEMLAAVNERRKLLGLALLTEVTPQTPLKEGVVPTDQKSKAAPPQRISKTSAAADIGSWEQRLTAAESAELATHRAAARKILEEDLQANPEALRNFKRQVLVQQGLELLDEDACPLCDQAWNLAALKAHLQHKLAKATEAAALLQKLEGEIAPLLSNLEEIKSAGAKIAALCTQAEPKLDPKALQDYCNAVASDRETLSRVSSDPAFIVAAAHVLAGAGWKPPTAATDVPLALKAHVASLPDPSKEDAAREFLIVAQERYDRCRATNAAKERAASRNQLASNVLAAYGASSNAVLEGVYDAVEKDFTDYYRLINHEDESGFQGELTPSPAKLAFDVDFYGRGKFPPGAYHSEGHQDGMGLCLYLALMKHTLGDDFTFAVLDDVLMSVDAGHRREVCSLLKSKFPKTQFVLTTHDPVWLQFMRTENLIQSSISFGGWSVDTGPQVWNDGDVWAQIDARLAKNDVPGAAATLRRYLEYVATVLADNLRAPVEYHGNGYYDLGDLMPPVVRAWLEHIDAAEKAAASWGQDTSAIKAFKAETKAKVTKTNTQQWMINKAVHYNAWANLQPHEFKAVADAFRDLLASMQCKIAPCAEFLYISPAKGEKQALRCGCGAINFNLTHK